MAQQDRNPDKLEDRLRAMILGNGQLPKEVSPSSARPQWNGPHLLSIDHSLYQGLPSEQHHDKLKQTNQPAGSIQAAAPGGVHSSRNDHSTAPLPHTQTRTQRRQEQNQRAPMSPRYPISSGKTPTYHPKQILQHPRRNDGSQSAGVSANVTPPRQPQNHQSSYKGMQNAQVHPSASQFNSQVEYLRQVAMAQIPNFEMPEAERIEKNLFRTHLEDLCQKAVALRGDGKFPEVKLQCFGSFSSGFATLGSDMDLAIVPLAGEAPFPSFGGNSLELGRLLEKELLEKGLGARLLTRTRVPILKVCQKPTPELYSALVEERKQWDELPEDQKYPLLVPHAESGNAGQETAHSRSHSLENSINGSQPNSNSHTNPETSKSTKTGAKEAHMPEGVESKESRPQKADQRKPASPTKTQSTQPVRPWQREKKLGKLDFPSSGVGVQCDINFSNHLALHNTVLLRCYSLCDPRVKPMIIFVKGWAKRRKINSSYSGTLSSYGFALMVLHFLMNVVSPPVLPNLQLSRPPTGDRSPSLSQSTIVDGYEVRFWRNEEQIQRLAAEGKITTNKQPLEMLLRNFFHYYVAQGGFVISRGFNWTREVLSLRTPGGILLKQTKGWTGAKTVISENVSYPMRLALKFLLICDVERSEASLPVRH